ncbi:hypothetical protein EVAR_75947_1 [Eumeta japonica]|uniref:Uncharacterized protein n=1 Tax=Eumeta variegata TaxID=151549 RepID=A0A4C1UW61_EUMVA|nr:hypothetical protein EVAR_75947_1 [Eumeta japonica]
MAKAKRRPSSSLYIYNILATCGSRRRGVTRPERGGSQRPARGVPAHTDTGHPFCFLGTVSICTDGKYYEDGDVQPDSPVLGDLIGRVQVNDCENFDIDDDLPLSSLARRRPDYSETSISYSNR